MLAVAILAGCTEPPAAPPQSPNDAAPAAGGPDVDRGRLLALACAACHTFGAGDRHGIGPRLHGVFGRQAATHDDFEYSPALRAAGFAWTPELLDRWLADPTGFVPGTTMAFTGYRRSEDRRDLIAYLVAATAP